METFCRELAKRIGDEMKEQMGLEEGDEVDVAGQQTIAGAVKKRTAAAKTHFSLVKAGPYAFIQWDESYQRKHDEQEAWIAA